ncbi:AraC family transcriptional regulator [Vibrio sinensis]|uniref:AraC family transcriptional regulator n=2 Tax=Vibrio sinensis TaxID=2302434 RepID=A0A3A6RET0_9VIBR|nr:AraC family transcriptional regulator [Vibrio sinensis]
MTTLKDSMEEVKNIVYDFSHSTELATVLVDIQGNEISERSNFSDFCNKIREDNKYFQICKNCDRTGGINSLKEKKIKCYTCHAGLVDFSVPVIQNGNLLGFIQCGQAKIENHSQPNIEQYKNSLLSQSSNLRILHNKIKSVSSSKIDSSVNIISRLVNHDIHQILKNIDEDDLLSSNEIHTIRSLNYQLHINEAQEFIKKNLHSSVSLEHVSHHVNLSPQYFCRIFKKNTGIGFSDYVNKQKLIRADRLLCEEKLTIEEVAKASGFGSSSYFIKQFKNHFDMTPKEYQVSIKNREHPINCC